MIRKGNAVCRLAAAAGVLVLSAAAASAQKFDAAHWKSQISVEGSREAGRTPSESEIWMKSGKMRMKTNAAGMSMNMLKLGDDFYTWTEGQGTGMKMNTATQRSNRPGSDYVNRIDEYRTKGKKVGAETVDGHPCEIWEYTDEHGAHGRYWLAQDLKNFPIKAVVESAGSKITYHNTDIQIPATISDSMLAVPSNVRFQDMSEMMKGMPPKH